MRRPTLSQELSVLKDEKKWIRKETKIFEKVFPFLKGHLLWKILLLILILIFIINNIALFTTIVFILLTSYIKFKRKAMRISAQIEPVYLFSVILTIAFGFNYGLLYIIIPPILSAFLSGMVNFGVIINMVSNLVVVLMIYFLPNFDPVLVGMVGVVLTDLGGLPLRLKTRQPPDEILMTIGTNALIRYIYFSFFLEMLLRMVGR